MTNTGNVVPIFGNATGPASPHEAYRLEADIETLLVARVCEEPTMWVRLGQHLDPSALGLPGSREALEAAARIVRETGRPPKDTSHVMQGIAAMHAEGKVTLDLKAAVKTLLLRGSAARERDTDEMLVHHLRPILQRRMRKEAARLAVDELSARGDGARVTELYELARHVGEAAPGASASRLDENTLVEMARSLRAQRATTGILELDSELRGGLPCGNLGVFMSGSGVGKSMALIHLAVANALQGRNVVYLTGELAVVDAKARAIANLFGVSLDALRGDAETVMALQEHMEEMTGWLGASFKLHFDWFEPRVTTPAMIENAVEAIEDKTGEPVHVAVVDYADKLRPGREQAKGDKGYMAAGDVYESLRLWCEHTRRWGWTASQGTRGDSKRKRLDMDHVADSMEKVRVSDLWVTLNPEHDDEQMIRYFVAKFRHGKSRVEVGPLPADFACARMAPLADPTLYPSVSLQGKGLK